MWPLFLSPRAFLMILILSLCFDLREKLVLAGESGHDWQSLAPDRVASAIRLHPGSSLHAQA